MLYALMSVAVVLLLGLGALVFFAIVLGDAVERAADGIHRIAATLSEPRSDGPDVAEMRRELAVMRRELADVDEKGEERFKRIQQRRRREAQTVPVEDDEPSEVQLAEMQGEAFPYWPPAPAGPFGGELQLRPSPKRRR